MGTRLAVERIQGEAFGEDAMLLDGANVARFFRLALLGHQLFDLRQQRGSLAIKSVTMGCSGASCNEVAP